MRSSGLGFRPPHLYGGSAGCQRGRTPGLRNDTPLLALANGAPVKAIAVPIKATRRGMAVLVPQEVR